MTSTEAIGQWLDQVTIDPAIYGLRADYVAGIVIARGLASGPSDQRSEALLTTAETDAATDAIDPTHLEHWRDTYRSFGENPKRSRISADSLTRRAAKSGLPRINRVVDTYNAISVLEQTPIGAEDLDNYIGPLRLTLAEGNEVFMTRRDSEELNEPPRPGEPIWRDDHGATCRRWNWRQTTRTAVTSATSNIVFIIDALGPDATATANHVVDKVKTTLNTPETLWAHRIIAR